MSYIVLTTFDGNRRSYLAHHGFRTTGNIASARRFFRNAASISDDIDVGLIAALEYITATKWQYLEVNEEVKQIVTRHYLPLD